MNDDTMLDATVAVLGHLKDPDSVRRIATHHETQHLRDRLPEAKRARLDAAIAAAEARTAPAPADAAAEVEWPSAEAAE